MKANKFISKIKPMYVVLIGAIIAGGILFFLSLNSGDSITSLLSTKAGGTNSATSNTSGELCADVGPKKIPTGGVIGRGWGLSDKESSARQIAKTNAESRASSLVSCDKPISEMAGSCGSQCRTVGEPICTPVVKSGSCSSEITNQEVRKVVTGADRKGKPIYKTVYYVEAAATCTGECTCLQECEPKNTTTPTPTNTSRPKPSSTPSYR